MRLAIVLYGEVLSPVVRSQTFPLVRRLVLRGHDVMLVAITSPRRWLRPRRYRETLSAARAAAGGRLTVLTHAPRHRSYDGVARRLRRALLRFEPDVVHARQSRGGIVAGRADVAPVLLDLRGIRPEEYLLSLEREPGPEELRVAARLREEDAEARALAAAVVCVSGPFREHLGGGEDVFVIPNAAAAAPRVDRRALRSELGLAEGETSFVYSGSLAAWQCVGPAARLFGGIRERRPGARLALLTHDLAGGRKLAESAGVPDAIVRSLSPGETRRTLPAFDAAFLLREDSIVNRVAAPVKFAEYLSAGLPVVLTEGIGDASGLVREHGLGVVLPGATDEGNAARVAAGLDPAAPARCRDFARERLSFDVTVPLYERACDAARGGRA